MAITRMPPEKSDAAVIRDATDLKQWLEKRSPAKRQGDGTRGAYCFHCFQGGNADDA